MINNFQRMRAEQDFDGLRKTILNFIDRITVTDEGVEISLKMNFGDVNIKGKNLNKSRDNIKAARDLPLTKRA